MKYLGGKSRIAKHLAQYLESIREGREFIEPFVGAASIVSRMGGKRRAYDAHGGLVALYQALQGGWLPPRDISEAEYQQAKQGELAPHLTAFIGFGCSFGGKYFGGYARSNKGENFASQSSNSLLKKKPLLEGVVFAQADYRDLKATNALIYCDPPYRGTTGYAVGAFDSDCFWNWVREMSKTNVVVVSEYGAPDDFTCVWQVATQTEMRTKSNGREPRVEKLFRLTPNN